MERAIKTISIPSSHGQHNAYSKKGRAEWVSWMMELAEWHEGRRHYAHTTDTENHTIGIGYKLNGAASKRQIEKMGLNYNSVISRSTRLSERELMKLFESQVNGAVAKAAKWVRNFYSLNDSRKAAIAYFCFVAQVNNFKKMAEAIEKENWESAVKYLEKSKWYLESGHRGPNIALILVQGEITGIR